MTTTTTRDPKFRLTGRSRKVYLVTHIVAAATWFGIDLALGILAITAMVTSDPETAGIALQAIALFAIWPMFGAALVSLGTGVMLGLGSKYGLLKYWWVAVKFGINLLMATLILIALRPGVDEAAAIGERLSAGDAGAQISDELIYPVLVAPTLLVIAFLLSVFKPWGRTRRGRRIAAGQQQPKNRELIGAEK